MPVTMEECVDCCDTFMGGGGGLPGPSPLSHRFQPCMQRRAIIAKMKPNCHEFIGRPQLSSDVRAYGLAAVVIPALLTLLYA